MHLRYILRQAPMTLTSPLCIVQGYERRAKSFDVRPRAPAADKTTVAAGSGSANSAPAEPSQSDVSQLLASPFAASRFQPADSQARR